MDLTQNFRKLYKPHRLYRIKMVKWKDSKEYKDWTERVKERDGFACVVCGKKEGRLNAHHLIPEKFRIFFDYRTDINNGLTLCAHHHQLGAFAAHKNPIWFIKWLAKNRSELYWIAVDRIRLL